MSRVGLCLNHIFNQDVQDIPRDIHFIGSGAESLIVHCLREGRMSCLDWAGGRQIWWKELKGPMYALSSPERWMPDPQISVATLPYPATRNYTLFKISKLDNTTCIRSPQANSQLPFL